MSDKEFEEGWGYRTWDASRMNRDEKLCRIIHLLEIMVHNQSLDVKE